MQKSKISNAEFKRMWDNGDDIDPDEVEDPILKNLYVEALAMWQDVNEVTEKIERYLDANSGHGRYIYEAGNEDANSEPDERRPKLAH